MEFIERAYRSFRRWRFFRTEARLIRAIWRAEDRFKDFCLDRGRDPNKELEMVEFLSTFGEWAKAEDVPKAIEGKS